DYGDTRYRFRISQAITAGLARPGLIGICTPFCAHKKPQACCPSLGPTRVAGFDGRFYDRQPIAASVSKTLSKLRASAITARLDEPQAGRARNRPLLNHVWLDRDEETFHRDSTLSAASNLVA